MKEILLCGRKIDPEKSKLLLRYEPGPDWQDYWTPMSGHWECKDGYLIGTEPGNKGGILFSKETYEKDILFSFTMASVLPATRDLNAIWCACWDEDRDYIGESYVCGLNGWYEGKSGIERLRTSRIKGLTGAYQYKPGTEVRMTCGIVDGRNFLLVDDELICELIDPDPIKGGHVGFSAYCTKLKIKDIEIREVYYEQVKSVQQSLEQMGGGSNMAGVASTMSVRLTMTAVTMIPIICVYPFVQKYYMKGIMLGAVKG